MSVIVKASGPADLLALIPSLVGFTPRDSIVLVAFRGKRTCGAIRFDLPRSRSKTVHSRIAASMVGTLCKLPAVDGVVVVVHTDDMFAGAEVVPHDELAQLLHRRIVQSGFSLRESLCQAADGWASYLDPFPAGGYPLSDVMESSAASEIPLNLRGTDGDQTEDGRIPMADPASVSRVAERLAQLRELYARLPAGSGDDLEEYPAEFEPLDDIPRFAEEALSWTDAQREANEALLIFAVQGPPMRDLVMLQWATAIEVGDALWNQAVGEPMPAGFTENDLGNLMLGIGPRPNPERVEHGRMLLRTLLSHATGRDRLPLLCMLAWLSWALGHGSTAGRLIDEARELDRDYGMAELLDTMTSNGMLPEWAFSGSTARDW